MSPQLGDGGSRGRMPVGDFRPWMRLLVMLAGIAAVGVAARSLSKKLVEARLTEQLRAVLEDDERVRFPPRPLVDLRGFPRPSASGATSLEAGESCTIEGILDGSWSGVEGAMVRALALDGAVAKRLPFGTSTDARGRFQIEGLPPTGPMGLLVTSRDGRTSLLVERIAEGVPGLATSVGRIALPREVALRVHATADHVEARAVAPFREEWAPIRFDRRALPCIEPTIFEGRVPEGLVEVVAVRDGKARAQLVLAGFGDEREIPLNPSRDPIASESAGGASDQDTGAPRDRWVFAAGDDAASGASLAGWRLVAAPDDRVPRAADGERRRELLVRDGESRLAPPDAPLATADLVVALTSAAGEPLVHPSALLDLFGSGVCVRGVIEPGARAPARARFSGVPHGDHVLVAIADGHLPTSEDVAVPPPAGAAPLAIALERAAEVSIAVDDADGKPSARDGLAVRVRAPGGRVADLAVPPSSVLVARRLPPGPLSFELMAWSGILGGDGGGAWTAPHLEPMGVQVEREVIAGDRNAKVTLRMPKEPRRFVVAVGRTRPGAWVYRSDARLDEPSGVTHADDAGRFAIVAPSGSRLLAAAGTLRAMLPFASATAPFAPAIPPAVSPTPQEEAASRATTFGEPASLRVSVVGRDGKPRPRALVTVRPIAPDGLGRASWAETAGADGRALVEGVAAGARCRVSAADGDDSGGVDVAAPGPGATADVRVEVGPP